MKNSKPELEVFFISLDIFYFAIEESVTTLLRILSCMLSRFGSSRAGETGQASGYKYHLVD